MPFVDRVLNRQSRGKTVPALVSNLHRELALLGGSVAQTETTRKTFGASTEASVREFQKRVGLRETGEVDAATGGIMALAARVIEEGNRAKLRQELRSALDRVPNSPEYAYWLARYAIIAGDYQTAYTAARRFSAFGPIVAVIDPVISVDFGPNPPEVQHPENFYAYRHELVPQSELQQLKEGVDALTREQYDAHFHITPPSSADEFADAKSDAPIPLEAIREWQDGTAASFKREFAIAALHYEQCQRAVIRYFKEDFAVAVTGEVEQDLASVLGLLTASNGSKWPGLWGALRWRRSLLSLKELFERDWLSPRRTDGTYAVPSEYLQMFMFFDESRAWPLTPHKAETRAIVPLLLLAFVFVPLARAEDDRLRRQFNSALEQIDKLLSRHDSLAPEFRFLCDFIERPYIYLLKAEILQDRADAEYKARIPISETDKIILDTARDEYSSRLPDPGGQNQDAPFQLLQAAKSYLQIVEWLRGDSEYVNRLNQGVDALNTELKERLAQKDVTSPRFRTIGKDITIPTIRPATDALPGLDRRVGPHQRLVVFSSPPSQPWAIPESNPRVYALLLETQARLLHLWFGFNYLGYRDDYVPPWRFAFLLERARYFAEHSKNAQREYLNFLGNAEREEFQEVSAAQNVEMEKSNVRIETARVDQVRLEVAASFESQQLASLAARNARQRVKNYRAFDEYADDILNIRTQKFIAEGISDINDYVPGLGSGLAAVGDILTGGFFGRSQREAIEDFQRGMELANLALAAEEADQAAEVAERQLEAAAAGLIVAGLQRQAALLRHEFAVQNLTFLRNRTLNAELWYRLVAAIRGVSETYLRYAVELAFLAEQAYEFEADKRINVIRFDYDLSEVGDYLAGDFLLKDLDTLEQDLIVNQRQRQQHARYVMSMAREFPEALQEIRETGKTTFPLLLEQIEQRFPGLYNVRLGAVDVLPVALMDSTRFSLELTHGGSGQVRLKSHPLRPPPAEPPSDPFADWPVQLRITGPETAIFSGLTRQDASAVFAFMTTGQRNAFEGLGAASSWEIDFSAKGNQVVPGTLADVVITFTVSGYYDGELRSALERIVPQTRAVTRWLSARNVFPDAFYEYHRSGKQVWKVAREQLALTDALGAVRNVAFVLVPAPGGANFGRLMSQYQLQIRITNAGDLVTESEIPQVTFSSGGAPLALQVQADLSGGTAGAALSWDFGDGTDWQPGAAQQHVYAKPGKYTVTLRVVRNGRLSEFRGNVVVSRSHADGLVPPVTAFPAVQRQTGPNVPARHTRVVTEVHAQAADPVVCTWRIGEQSGVRGESATFDLKPGNYILHLRAVRKLKAHVYNRQQYLPDPSLEFDGFSLASNRRFSNSGTEITGTGINPPANALTTHLLAGRTMSPVDDWTIELSRSGNPCLRSVAGTDNEQPDLAEISDVLIAIEYETTPGATG